MTLIQPILYILLDRFPKRKETIKALFKNNESFRTLCEDYRRCSEALRHWNQSMDEDAAARVREYEALLLDLEEEILQNVNQHRVDHLCCASTLVLDGKTHRE